MDLHANIQCYNAQKSKCLVALPHSRRSLASLLSDCDFRIGRMPMEMVSSYCHLVHIVTSSLDDSPDIISRQNSFIDQVNSMLCFIGKLFSEVKIRSYCTSLYGCQL